MAVLKVLFVLCFMRVVIVSAVGESGNCGDPPTSQKAVLDTNLDAFPVDTPLTYSCRPGYIWDRSSSRKVTCQKDLTWTELKITCNPKSCGSLPDISHGQIQYSDGIGFGSTAHMSCDPGYNIVGRNQRVCLADGWDHQNPVCEPKSCGPLPDVLHGSIEYSEGFNFGSVARIFCDEGYGTVGRNQRVCLVDGWNHQNPDCKPILCDTPPEIVDGLVDLGSFSRYITVGTVATYRCNKFQLIGNATIYCTKSGTWSSSPPICKDVKCPDPEVANGYKTSNFGPIYLYLHSTTFKCKLGYWMTGSSRIVCKEDNTWHPSPPTCKLFSFAKSCGPLPDIPHGIIEYSDGVDFGSVAQMSCEEGYKLVGKNLRVCLFDGWSHQNPVCERFCGDPPTSQKAVLDSNLNVFPVNTTLTYSCHPGYIWDRSSSNKVICQEDSTWTELKITCTPKSCGPLPDMPHGIIEYSDGVYFGSVAQMSCEEGYNLVGRNLRVCLFDGWSHQNPVCERK